MESCFIGQSGLTSLNPVVFLGFTKKWKMRWRYLLLEPNRLFGNPGKCINRQKLTVAKQQRVGITTPVLAHRRNHQKMVAGLDKFVGYTVKNDTAL